MSLKKSKVRVSPEEGFRVRNTASGSYKHRRKRGKRRIVAPVLVLCAVLALLVAADYWTNSGEIYRGVAVGSVDLGGKTPDEARALVEEQASSDLREIRFTGAPEDLSLSTQRLGLSFDAAGTVDDAYGVGREGSVLKRLGDRVMAAWSTVTVPPVVDYNRVAARGEIQNLAARVNAEPRDGAVNISGGQAEVVESREGYNVNVDATAANVDEALNAMSGEVEVVGERQAPAVLTPAAEAAAAKAQQAMASGPVQLSAGGENWKLSAEKIGQTLSFTPEGGELRVGLDQERFREVASDMFDDLTVEAAEAEFEVQGNGVSVVEGQTGKQIEEEQLFGNVEAGLFQGQRNFQVPVTVTEPELTTEEAEALKPTELIGSYRTNYAIVPDEDGERAENLEIASSAINGTFLAPGEVFSVNEVAAPLEYNKTKVIIEGREEKADGGGLCQVSSTLYMAANYAGLDIIERHPHYAQLPYIRPGLDATVWFGSLDMKFENTTDGYVLLQERVADDGYIYAEIWGKPTGKKVEMDSEPEYRTPEEAKWITYQKVTENGEVIFDGELHKDSYKPLTDEKGKVIAADAEELEIAPVNP
ncbi:MAG: Vancomycin B-type resistance protein VanW [uncultured Rubrobacteraceae bacterium]|uniref:Vancomycin B-type resistance protein VanW n=1 Tax=uncultured Rubrobacteraceae bacterium TaxID=349277 RepID=A0A6J4Q636_9ACTN|nr:MAG: Vancomycin B-type resistance protein VanW [uncultured Rubrobacteraceae bacterium]